MGQSETSSFSNSRVFVEDVMKQTIAEKSLL